MGLGLTVVFIWLEGLVVVVWPGRCVVVVVDNNGSFGIIEMIVSVELVGVGVVEFIGVPMLVPTGGLEGSFLATHLPDLQKYLDQHETEGGRIMKQPEGIIKKTDERENYETARWDKNR